MGAEIVVDGLFVGGGEDGGVQSATAFGASDPGVRIRQQCCAEDGAPPPRYSAMEDGLRHAIRVPELFQMQVPVRC